MDSSQTIEDFSLLILAHMASVDGYIHPTERDTILTEIPRLFPQITDVEPKLNAACVQLTKIGKESAEKMIEDNLSTLSTLSKEQKEIFYILLFDVLNSDGKVNEEETRTLRLLKTFFLA